MKKIKLRQVGWDNGFQTWVKRIYLYDDKQLALLGDWSVGFFHCEQCGAIQGFAVHVPKNIPKDGVPEGRKMWQDFLLAHSHGDGRAQLFKR